MSIIRQCAFDGDERLLKGALHCHTTRSDGAGTPEEVIRLHHQNGYDFLAITDHRKYNFKNYAPEVPLTILPGMEFDCGIEWDKHGFRVYHTVCVGPAKEDGNGYEQDQFVENGECKTQEAYQVFLDDIHAKGNLTVHCHPQWSNTPPRYFENLKGNFAMEIWNSGCAMLCDMDMDAAYWDELLGQGKVIYGVATDDGHAMDQHCNGWVRVNAKNDVNSILSALKKGAFYSSCGPEIYDFYIEDGKVVLECSPVSKVRVHCDKFPTYVMRFPDQPTTHVEFPLDFHWAGSYPYLRISIIDENGKHAWTNPIFLDGRKEE